MTREPGAVRGSRYGTLAVLESGIGNCWDRADCFVSVCRAAGIPCRQVAGWIYGKEGHIWAEVLVEGRGWQQCDPSGGPVGWHHVPWFVTEDGEMPVLYARFPTLTLSGSD